MRKKEEVGRRKKEGGREKERVRRVAEERRREKGGRKTYSRGGDLEKILECRGWGKKRWRKEGEGGGFAFC